MTKTRRTSKHAIQRKIELPTLLFVPSLERENRPLTARKSCTNAKLLPKIALCYEPVNVRKRVVVEPNFCKHSINFVVAQQPPQTCQALSRISFICAANGFFWREPWVSRQTPLDLACRDKEGKSGITTTASGLCKIAYVFDNRHANIVCEICRDNVCNTLTDWFANHNPLETLDSVRVSYLFTKKYA